MKHKMVAFCVLAVAGCRSDGRADQIDTGGAAISPDAWPDGHAEYLHYIGAGSQYARIQESLAHGWNTWDTRDVLRYVLLPEGLAVDLDIKRHAWLDEGYLGEALIGRGGAAAERIRPGARSLTGSYVQFDIEWQGLSASVEAGHSGKDLVVLVTPQESNSSFELVVSVGLAWNRAGTVETGDRGFVAQLPSGAYPIHVDGVHETDPHTETLLPHRVLRLDRPVGISSGRARRVEEIRRVLDRRRAELEARAREYDDLRDAFLAIGSAIAWNTVYDPRHQRVVSTVGRLWNREYGGLALFGWDNFFLAYLAAIHDRELAIANVIEHLRGATAAGFVPNDNRGNGSKSWDRSQPPVGGLMVREVYRRYPERWFLEAVFDPLLSWNRWWVGMRLNEGLLSYGSHAAANPFNEPAVRSARTARYESGMDDSPMYEGVPFNAVKNTLELQDVGLTSLYVADCLALAELGRELGRAADARELERRALHFSNALDRLWVEESGYYLNYRTDVDRPSDRRSPTLFYPLVAGVPGPERAERMIREHLLNPLEFWGDHVLPSITRDDPSFPRQRYWNGAIWPPLNFLVYLGLREAEAHDVASTLAEKSLGMFVNEWRRHGYVSENYSSITGTGDDERLSSDSFHAWGGLLALPSFIEAGYLAPPENPLRASPGIPNR